VRSTEAIPEPEWFRCVVVGITGGSASGKTTFADALANELRDLSPVVLNQDAYFRDWSEYAPDERERVVTANHPDAVRWGSLIEHVSTLREGRPVRTPIAGTRASARGDAPATVEPSAVVIVEGHLILTNARLRELFDVRLYLEVDPHERVLRRMLRDVATRGGDLERAVAWYRRDVIPNFAVHTEPTKQYADLIVPFHRENRIALGTIAAGVRAMLSEGSGNTTS
jgi:uridine kinase